MTQPLPPSWSECLRVPSVQECLDRGIICTDCTRVFPREAVKAPPEYALPVCPYCGSPAIDWALLTIPPT